MEAMDKWVAEFFLRRQQNPRVYATTLFPALKFVNPDCTKLKITAVLRDISNSLIRGTVDEGILDLLEILEKLLLQEYSVIMESLESAYCWTAIECTIRFMWPVNASDGLFSDALERIWTKRIGILKEKKSELVAHELLKWETDLKKAIEDPEIYHKIRETNARYIAISQLSQLLKEHWALLGCSSLESEAQRLLKRKDTNLGRASDAVDSVNEEPGTGEWESNREKCIDVEEVEKPDEVDKENELEEEHEPILNMGDITVAKELKVVLLEIQELIHLSSKQSQGPSHSLDVPSQAVSEKGGGEDDNETENSQGPNHSLHVSSQADRENRTESGGGENHNETENSQETSSSSERVRPHLPSREPLNVSPLKKGRLASPRPRRLMKFWLPEEMEALKKGVKEYGKSWKDIKNSNPEIFADRTEVDLKDK